MFDDIDEKLEIIAWVNFVCWCILAFFSSVIEPSQLLFDSGSVGLTRVVLVVGCLINGYVSSAIINGFAKLITFTYTIANDLKRNNEKLDRILEAQKGQK